MKKYSRKCDEKKLFEILAKGKIECVLQNDTLSADVASFTFGFTFPGSVFERNEVILCGFKKTACGYDILLLSVEDGSEKMYSVGETEAYVVFRDTRLQNDIFPLNFEDMFSTVISDLMFVAWFYGEDILTEKEKEFLKAGIFYSTKKSDLYDIDAESCKKCAEYIKPYDMSLSKAFSELALIEGKSRKAKKKIVEHIEKLLPNFENVPDERALENLCDEVCLDYEKNECINMKKLNELCRFANDAAHNCDFTGVFPQYLKENKYIEFKVYRVMYEDDGEKRFYDIGVSYGDKDKGLAFSSVVTQSDILPVEIMNFGLSQMEILISGINDILNGGKPSDDFDLLPQVCIHTSKKHNTTFNVFLLCVGLLMLAVSIVILFEGNMLFSQNISCYIMAGAGFGTVLFTLWRLLKNRKTYISHI